jgi:soluble lytic murein transglycosylase-like protein
LAASFIAAVAATLPTAEAQVYASRPGADATLVLSDFPSREAPTLLIEGPRPVQGNGKAARQQARSPVDGATLNAMIDRVARETGVSDQLLLAVIATESASIPTAVSPKGAVGLMQLMPATARRFGVVDLSDPFENIRGGALYLKWLLEHFDGNLALALAGYNAGEEAVIRAGYRIPPYAETQRYVPRVLDRLRAREGS